MPDAEDGARHVGFRDGWLAAAEHLINYGTPETFLLGEDLRTRFIDPLESTSPGGSDA